MTNRVEVDEALALRVLEQLQADWARAADVRDAFDAEIEAAFMTPALSDPANVIWEEMAPRKQGVIDLMKAIAGAPRGFTREELVAAIDTMDKLHAAHARHVEVLRAARVAATKGSA